jgi:lipopolysaccharide/colanic/teichoic acid biosynthesis glycosyltransferase
LKKRFVFYIVNYFFVVLLIVFSVFLYFLRYDNFVAGGTAFVQERFFNLFFISLTSYFFLYVFELISFSHKFQKITFDRLAFSFIKILIILSLVSFLEFFLFYSSKVGRLIYFYFLILLLLYYLVFLFTYHRSNKSSLLWLSNYPFHQAIKDYSPGWNQFILLTPGQGLDLDPNIDLIVYENDFITEGLMDRLIKFKMRGAKVVQLINFLENQSQKIPTALIDKKWLLSQFNNVSPLYLKLSRFFDIGAGCCLLILLLPVATAIAALHKSFSKGPLFYIQERIGLNGRPFSLIKFRTMPVNAEQHGARYSGENDLRITKIGKWMRKLRIDEIPQFINVVRGDMSLIGPRPERQVFIKNLEKEIPFYRLRLQVKPGLTGWAQINGEYAGEDLGSHRNKLEYDLYYIKNRNSLLDLMIIIKTLKIILLARGE